MNKFFSVYLGKTHNVGDCRTENSSSVPFFKIAMHSNFNTRKKWKGKVRNKFNKEIQSYEGTVGRGAFTSLLLKFLLWLNMKKLAKQYSNLISNMNLLISNLLYYI